MASKVKKPEVELLNLDNVDGFEFERICKRILEKLDYGEVENTQCVGDEGRDLIVRSRRGTIVVECKHQPGSSIGRPVIQKLHSAVISYNSNHGMLITTGKFSRAALNYASKLRDQGFTIDLIDQRVLTDMCSRAGIKLHVNGKEHHVWQYYLCDDSSFRNCVSKYLNNLYVSYPEKPSQLTSDIHRDISLESAYEAQFDLDAIYSTTVGVIHRDHARDECIFISGTDGSPFNTRVSEFYQGLSRGNVTPVSTEKSTISRLPFRLDGATLKEIAKNEIVRRYTRQVTYVGGNNHTYCRVCQPNERQFTITSIQQVYFPLTKATFRVLNRTYNADCLEHTSGKLELSCGPLRICRICGTEIQKKPHLCNSCGNPYHNRVIFSHGFMCRDCGRTICRECTTYSRHFVMRRKYCSECGKKHQNRKALLWLNRTGR